MGVHSGQCFAAVGLLLLLLLHSPLGGAAAKRKRAEGGERRALPKLFDAEAALFAQQRERGPTSKCVSLADASKDPSLQNIFNLPEVSSPTLSPLLSLTAL